MTIHNSQLNIILLIVFIGFVGASIAYPIFPPLFLHPSKENTLLISFNPSMRGMLLGLALAAYPLGQFFGSPLLGSYSDHYGRKSTMVMSLLASAMGYFLSALSLHLNWLWVLITSRFLTGLLEGNIVIAQAMAADLTHLSKYKSFGRISGAAAIGYIMGPLLGGFLSDHRWFSYAFPFLVAGLLSIVTALFTWISLQETKEQTGEHLISIWEQFNVIRRFVILFKNPQLKFLLIMSFTFTLGVDIFYEFGPVFLAGHWSMDPSGIALYNSILCLTLALGSAWLAGALTHFLKPSQIILCTMICTGLFLILMSFGLSKLIVFILFALCGFSIATTNTSVTIMISNAGSKRIQGEVLGAQLGLRTLGDACICLIGGLMIISSVSLPLVIAGLIALIAASFYKKI